MKLQHTLQFKLSAATLIILHILVFALRDAAVVYADDATTTVAAESATTDTSVSSVVSDTPQATQASSSESKSSDASAQSQSAPSDTKSQSESKDTSKESLSATASSSPNSQFAKDGPSSFNTSVLQNLQPSLFTGAITYSIPIAVAQGRKGIQPNVSLTYSSQSGTGMCGVGWSVDLGNIERSTKSGPPKYTSADTFLFKSGGSVTELVNIGGNEYRAKIEGAFMKFVFDGTTWTVTDKSGIVYYFGSNSASRIESGSNVFSWNLDKVKEINGNYMTIAYTKDNNQLYPDTINYTGFEGTPSLSPTSSVVFSYETRPDPIENYRGAFLTKTTKRIKHIVVRQNAAQLRRYQFDYQSSSSTRRSLLQSVTQYGSDDVAVLPSITFEYQQNQWGWVLDSGWILPAETKFADSYRNDKGVRFADMNLDGLADLTRGFEAHNPGVGDENNYIYYNNPDKTWTKVDVFNKFLHIFNRGGLICDSGMRLVDVNNDGWPDLVRAHDTMQLDNVYYTYLHDKNSSWYRDDAWLIPTDMRISYTYDDDGQWPDPVHYCGVMLTDINGDGYTDLFKAEGGSCRSYLNNGLSGIGWTRAVSWDMPEGSFSDGTTQLADINGDGMMDFVIADGSNRKTYINNGSNWFLDTSRQIPEGNFTDGSTQVMDLNNDGLADIVIAKGTNPKKVYINTGSGWVLDSSWVLPAEVDLDNGGTRFADINGDGLVDILIYYSSDPQKVYLANGPYPDLLKTVSNGIGGSAQIDYKSQKGADNTEAADKSKLPFPVQVVSRITTSDGRGNSYHTDYSYDKGEFNFSQREFRGFGKVKVIDADGNYSLSYFLQGEYDKGRPSKQETYDQPGHLYARSENTWTTTTPYAGYSTIQFIYLSESNSYTYEDQLTARRTKTQYFYEEPTQYGNPTKVIDYGEVNSIDGTDIGTDKKTTLFEYTYNPAVRIVSLPKHVQINDYQDIKISEKQFYYDNHASTSDQPTQGLLTKEEVWLKNPITLAESWLSSQYGYDTFGNLTSTTDANNHSTTTTYETTYYIYPITVTNALGHQVKTVYYGVNESAGDLYTGSGLFGQTKSTEDPNGIKSYAFYDKLGRQTKSIGPNDSENYPASVVDYDLTTTPIRIIQKVKASTNPGSLDYPYYYASYAFYDGLGREIESKAPAEPDPANNDYRQIISGATLYNSRGLVVRKYFPYFVTANTLAEQQAFTEPDLNHPHSTIGYDALGRPTHITNPDSTFSTKEYGQWQVTATDENAHYHTYYYDAQQKLIQVDENNQGQVYSTTYGYDTSGNLIRVTDSQNHLTQITYDSLGRKIQMNDPDMGIWKYEYDSVGNLTKQTDAANQELVFTYDVLNRLTQKTIQASQNVVYEYDNPAKQFAKGRLTKVTYSAGSTEFFYDNLGRETKSIKVVDANSYTVERTYDALDRLSTLTYPDAEVVIYTYNPQGIETVTSSAGRTYISNINYSPTSQLTKVQYGNGVTTEYNYNPNTLRLEHLTTQDSGLTAIQDLQYQFDNVGNISSITDSVHTGTQSFAYDDLNRLTYANGASYGVINYSYDSIGNILTKGNKTYHYTGTRPHAVSSIVDGPTTVNFDYDANGNLYEKRTQGNGDLTRYHYDYESHLSQVEQQYALGTSMEVTLELKPGWNFFSLPLVPTDNHVSAVFSSLNFGTDYDQVSRYNPDTDSTESFVNDPNFNQFDTLEYNKGYSIYITANHSVFVRITGTSAGTQSIALSSGWNLIPYPYLSRKSVQQGLGNLQQGVDYDKVLEYNQTTGTFIEYPGDLSQLRSEKSYYIHCLRDTSWNIEPLSRTTEFYYDGDGGRVKRSSHIDKGETTVYIGSLFEKSTFEDPDQPTATKKHIYAGANRVCTVDYGLSTVGVRYYHSDHLGSSNVVTDENGTQLQLIEYSPFGEISTYQGSYDTDIRYTGKIQDDTGLYYYGARYYDPAIGRFITPDTIVQAPDDPQTLNRYAYCRNNPLNLIDPTGHKWSWKKFWNSFAGAFVGAIVTVLTGGLGAPLAFALGGMVGGAITGGLEGGWQGALMGGLMGGVLGGALGLGVNAWGAGFGYVALAAGGGYAIGTGHADSFIGGLSGGFVGSAVGNGIQSYYEDGISLQMPEGQNNPYDNKNWDVLGIGTTDAKAAAFANKNSSAVFYTKSRGYFSDFVRAGMQKVCGNSLASRQFAGYLRGANGFNVAAHSEGTLTLSGAIKALSADGVKLPQTHFSFNGPVIMQSTANNLAAMVGAPAPSYNLNIGDPIGIFATLNPVKASLYGVIGVPTLATFHSTNHYPAMNIGK